MLGATHLTTRTAAWLADEVPRQLATIRTTTGTPARLLPDPLRVIGHDVRELGIDEWPALVVTPATMGGMSRVDVNPDGGETYAVTYSATVYAWVRGDTYADTTRARDAYALAIRSALLTRKQLTAATAFGQLPPGATVWVKPETIREDYAPVTDDGARTIAAVRVDVDVVQVETWDGPTVLNTTDTARTSTATADVLDGPAVTPPAAGAADTAPVPHPANL